MFVKIKNIFRLQKKFIKYLCVCVYVYTHMYGNLPLNCIQIYKWLRTVYFFYFCFTLQWWRQKIVWVNCPKWVIPREIFDGYFASSLEWLSCSKVAYRMTIHLQHSVTTSFSKQNSSRGEKPHFNSVYFCYVLGGHFICLGICCCDSSFYLQCRLNITSQKFLYQSNCSIYSSKKKPILHACMQVKKCVQQIILISVWILGIRGSHYF